MNFFPKLKSWQLFLLFISFTAVGVVAMPIMAITRVHFIILWPILLGIYLWPVLINFLWQYSIAENLVRRYPETIKLNPFLLKFWIFVPVAFILFLAIALSFRVTVYGLMWIFACYLVSKIFMIFSARMVARSLKQVTHTSSRDQQDYVLEIFLFWFMPVIGIWILQPRVSKALDQI